MLSDIPKLEKANMLLLSKEMTDKDKSMKTQLLFKPNKEDKLSGEKIWKEDGFLKDIRAELNLEKVNIPENCLLYVNQGFLSSVKSGEVAMYLHNFVIGQLIIAANQPKDISTFICSKNEVKLLSCVYIQTGNFKGIREQVAFIVLRGDVDETFFSYGFDKLKSKLLYSFLKQQIPNAFVSVAFKKHFQEIMSDESRSKGSSSLFYFLPSVSDRKEEINQHKNNVALFPIDITTDFIESFSVEKVSFRPDLLSSSDEKERKPQTEMLYGLFKHIAKLSNQNLERNIAHLNIKQGRNEMEWSNSKFDSSKFKLTY